MGTRSNILEFVDIHRSTDDSCNKIDFGVYSVAYAERFSELERIHAAKIKRARWRLALQPKSTVTKHWIQMFTKIYAIMGRFPIMLKPHMVVIHESVAKERIIYRC
ncbi:hypothetical protein TNCT_151891 [Trichonephila clavata]|uniref:Uncharacterized protein n=1 Tax=Trichonephila clavata TaxID=2740835 RepID=A0A8X6HDX0_TRICU|nr:hypothetical protein TNCT_151891 [Trichonephila clavata]